MKITKQKVIMGFTIFIILAFVLEAFVVFMWKPVEEPTPTPSPQAQDFEGSGTVKATIRTLGGTLFVSCNTTEDVSGPLKTVPGVLRVVAAGTSAYMLMLSNASQDIASAIQEKLAGTCDAAVLRSSKLEFKETLTATEFPPGNATKVLAPKDLDYLQSVYPPYVDARHAEGDEVTVRVMLQISAEGLRVVMEEKLQAAPQQTTYEGGGFGVARVAELEDALWVQCNSTDDELELSQSYDVNSTHAVEKDYRYVVDLIRGDNMTKTVNEITSRLGSKCDLLVFRYAILDFTDDISVASENNETRVIPAANLTDAYAFVQPSRNLNETILVSVMVQMLGNGIIGTAMQDAG